jgi:hypothetical protein
MYVLIIFNIEKYRSGAPFWGGAGCALANPDFFSSSIIGLGVTDSWPCHFGLQFSNL